MNYAVILVGDICTVLPESTLCKYDIIVFKGSREQCCQYQDNYNRSYLKNLLSENGFHRTDFTIKPERS